MVEEGVRRTLAAILAADMVGYSRLMEADETGTVARQKTHRSELIDPAIAAHGGRIVKTTGDGILVEFASAVAATECAVAIQRSMAEREAGVTEEQRILYRVGINLGDIIIDGDDILGDGVNIAARLQEIAPPGGLCISGTVFDHLKRKVDVGYEDLGDVKVKNIATPVRVYRVMLAPEAVGKFIRATKRISPRQLAFAAGALLAIGIGAIIYQWAYAPSLQLAPTTVAFSPQPIKASLAVLPFRNISGDPEQEVFVTGLTSDLNSALARIPQMLVISDTSTSKFKGQTDDIQHIADELGVEHVLTGTVQRSGERVRVSVQLTDGRTGASVWSNRYDREIAEFLSLQDDIVRNILIGLQIELTHGDSARFLSRGTDNIEAWILSIQAQAEGFKFTAEGNRKARDLFEAAAIHDPNWAGPVGGLAWTYREALRRGWSKEPGADRKKWLELAERAVKMDPKYYGGYIQLGNYHIENGNVEEGLALREKALELAPNDLSALSGLAWQLVLIGKVKRGLELLGRAKQVSPITPGWLLATEAYALQVDGQYDRAINAYEKALRVQDFPVLHARIAAIYAEKGNLEAARRHASLFLQKRPNGKVSDLTKIFGIQDPKQTERYAEFLRAAGIPD